MAAARGSKKDAPLPRLTFDQIDKADDLERGVVNVPEWNGSVAVRGLTAREWESAQQMDNDEGEAYLLSCGIEDPPLSVEEAAKLRDKSAVTVIAINSAILQCSKMDAGSLEAAQKRFFPGASVEPGPEQG